MFNRGDKMMINAIVALYTLRKHYDGNITFYLQPPCSDTEEFKKSLRQFNCDIVELEGKDEYKTLVQMEQKVPQSCPEYFVYTKLFNTCFTIKK